MNVNCASEIKINKFILFFSQFVLHLQYYILHKYYNGNKNSKKINVFQNR